MTAGARGRGSFRRPLRRRLRALKWLGRGLLRTALGASGPARWRLGGPAPLAVSGARPPHVRIDPPALTTALGWPEGGGVPRSVRIFRDSQGASTIAVLRVSFRRGHHPESAIAKVFRPFGPREVPRELAAYTSGVLQGLPPPCAVPGVHGVTDAGGGATTLWLEDVGPLPDRMWHPMSLREYEIAGEALGGMGGRFASAPPSAPWLAAGTTVEHGRRWLLGEAWTDRVRAGCALHRRLARASARTGALLAAFSQLRPTLCHQDATPRNLALGASGSRVVFLDWEACGLGPLGQDLASLVWSLWRYAGVKSVLECEAAATRGYLVGVEREGGSLTPARRQEIRLAYLVTVAVRYLVEIVNVARYDTVDAATARFEEAAAMVAG